MIAAIAAEVDFVSIGTNDLAHLHLGLDRGAGGAPAHHPAVLRLVDEVVVAAHQAGLAVEVCGEAASDALVIPLLVGLGVDELSCGAARVGEVRQRVRLLRSDVASALADRALDARSAAEVEAIVAPLVRSGDGVEAV
jgi:multiphosphoryl transfer protein